MADDIQAKRTYVTNMYPNNPKWANKVRHMSDIQVIAIYLKEKEKEAQGNQPTEKEKDDDIPF